jgi:GxxExxY protein
LPVRRKVVKLMYQLTEKEEYLCKAIIDCAYKVHSQLGSGLLEKIYEACFAHELKKKEIPYIRQATLPVFMTDCILMKG